MSMYMNFFPDGSTIVGYDVGPDDLDDWWEQRRCHQDGSASPTNALNKAGLIVLQDGNKLRIVPFCPRHSTIYASSRLVWDEDWESQVEMAADMIVRDYCRENGLSLQELVAMSPPGFDPTPDWADSDPADRCGDTHGLAALCLLLDERGLINEPDAYLEARFRSRASSFDCLWTRTKVKLL